MNSVRLIFLRMSLRLLHPSLIIYFVDTKVLINGGIFPAPFLQSLLLIVLFVCMIRRLMKFLTLFLSWPNIFLGLLQSLLFVLIFYRLNMTYLKVYYFYAYLAWGFLNFLVFILCCLFLILIILQGLLFLKFQKVYYI